MFKRIVAWLTMPRGTACGAGGRRCWYFRSCYAGGRFWCNWCDLKKVIVVGPMQKICGMKEAQCS